MPTSYFTKKLFGSSGEDAKRISKAVKRVKELVNTPKQNRNHNNNEKLVFKSHGPVNNSQESGTSDDVVSEAYSPPFGNDPEILTTPPHSRNDHSKCYYFLYIFMQNMLL